MKNQTSYQLIIYCKKYERTTKAIFIKGFGGNFVLFAKETAQVFGVQKLGLIYPYVGLDEKLI